MINKPSDINLGNLFEKVELPLDRADLAEQPVFHGGPVQTERGFVLHEPVVPAEATAGDSVYASTHDDPRRPGDDHLQGRARGHVHRRRPARACWSRSAMRPGARASWRTRSAENSWLTVGADPAVIFDTPIEQRYDSALSLLGLDAVDAAASEAGHA